ncbi:hypothetical protein GM418_26330 [Maribellus comscasis]|uniref:Uncharacterized protein n=1 Tax=Maribellus comscasis TaxID=2681766 RepID=A0A6I6K3Q5_9BACT|nr:hypothetical protein [Maribellus comscasis]QGY47052.1 hypothetical protein GM418_26330 [Maribellus comscasis]
MNDKIHIDLLVNSERVKLDQLSEFKVGLKISCDGEESIPFDISDTKLFVNNEQCVVWDLTVQNGTITNLKILCGKPARIEWPLGKGLFSSSGNYRLKLKWFDLVREKEIVVEE